MYALSNAKFLPKESILEGRGTDASNMHDEEAEEEDFSDDEQVIGWLRWLHWPLADLIGFIPCTSLSASRLDDLSHGLMCT